MLLILVHIVLTVSLLVFLFLGLVQCRKHSFKAGFYFFLILIVHKLASYIYSPLLRKFIDSLATRENPLPMGMTIGEFVSWFSLFPTMIDLIAYGILVVGIYKMWRNKIPQY